MPTTSSRLPDSDLIEVRVTGRRPLTDRVDEFTLTPLASAALPDWSAGSHIDIHTPGGAVRQYSLISLPGDTGTYRVAVDRCDEGRGGSVSLHRGVQPGSQLGISRPRNHFALSRALRYVFVAGGIGITPILSLAAQAEQMGRPWSLLYTGSDPTRMPYAAELSERFGDRVVIHSSSTAGRLNLSRRLADLEPGTAVYACGPESLIADAESACADQDAVDVFAERFVAADRQPASDEPFEVSLALSHHTVTVPAGRTILDALDDAGVVTVSSCREGVCGTCEAEVVSGEIEHRDSVLTPEERAENETMMLCVSRCTSGRLVLDL
ncbi:PDR/VanB family oxidoreductase [Gordonia sp. DT30]|uniref:PDR/VanB family oxidoreductase n=1 Tax=Gordonia sp. DT30 TaxID=3416546 RepID=UPI003CE79B4C